MSKIEPSCPRLPRISNGTKRSSRSMAPAISESAYADLPEGWVEVPLSECCEINPRHPKGLDDAMPVSFAPMTALSEEKPAFQELKERPLGAVRKGFTHFAEGDVLFAKITPCMENGKGAVATGLRNGLGCGTTELHVIRPREDVDPLYVYRFLSQNKVRAAAKETFTSSAGQARVPTSFIADLEIPLPPLAEQKRIVAKVEELLARVNAAREKLNKVPAIFKRFRQSVLAAACTGRLTEEWRSKQSMSFACDCDDLPEGWKRHSLRDLCNGFEYGSSHKSNEIGDVPVLRMGNLQNGEIDWGNLKYSSDHAEISKYSLLPNTVLFNRTNSPELVGKTAIYRGERPALYAGYLIRIVHGPKLNSEYLNYCLNDQSFREYCIEVKTDGVSQSNINAQKLAAFEIPLPPLAEQREIVSQIKRLFALADSVEKQAAAATVRVEKLTQAVLAKAFRGELV